VISGAGKNEPERLPSAGGQGDVVLSDPGHLRGDARLAARLISLGVVTEERAAALLRRAFALAEGSADSGNVRDFAACMRIPIEAAKLEQREFERITPQQHLHGHFAMNLTSEERERHIDAIRAEALGGAEVLEGNVAGDHEDHNGHELPGKSNGRGDPSTEPDPPANGDGGTNGV